MEQLAHAIGWAIAAPFLVVGAVGAIVTTVAFGCIVALILAQLFLFD